MKPTGDTGDRAFERLLSREVSRPAAAADACPQVELLSAWFDRALPDVEAAAVETHLAGCGRCQALIGQLARTEPEVLYVHPKPEPTPWIWHLRWAAPLAAASIVVFVVGTRQLIAPDTSSRVPPLGTPVNQMAKAADRELAAPGESVPGGLPAGAEPSAPQVAGRSSSPAREIPPTGKPGPSKSPAPTPEESAAPTGAPKSVAEGQLGHVAGADATAGLPAAPQAEELTRRNAKVATPAAPPQPPAAAPAPSTLALQNTPKTIVTGAPAVAGAAPEMRKAESARADKLVLLDARAQRVEPAAFVPGGTAGWRYAKPGLVLRTLDGGAHWAEQALPGGARVLALSAVSSSLCWAAGADGVILRTTDGSSWQAIPSPTKADIGWISALDDHRVTMRTADGITYDSGDGGATWRRR